MALLQTAFLAGDIWPVILPNAAVLAVMAGAARLGQPRGHPQEAGLDDARIAAAHRGAHPQGAARRAEGPARAHAACCCRRSCSVCCSATPRPTISTMCPTPCSIAPRRRLAGPAGETRRHGALRARRQSAHAGATCAPTSTTAAPCSWSRFRTTSRRRLAAGTRRGRADHRRWPQFQHGGYRSRVRPGGGRAPSTPTGAPATGLPGPPVTVEARAWYNPNLVTRWNMIPGLIGTLTMIQTLMLTAMSVAREREQGTFDQLLVTPFRPAEIMAGKALPSMLVGIVQATGVLLVAQLWFRIPFPGLVPDALRRAHPVRAGGRGHRPRRLGALPDHAAGDAVLVRSHHAVRAALRPDHAASATCRALCNTSRCVNPLRYAIDIAQRVYLEGAGLGVLLPDLWPLAAIAAITLAAASWMFRHRLQ